MLLNEITRRYRQHRNFRRTFDELNAMGDRELADIGLSRSNIYEVARDVSKTA